MGAHAALTLNPESMEAFRVPPPLAAASLTQQVDHVGWRKALVAQ